MNDAAHTKAYQEGQDACILGNSINPYRKRATEYIRSGGKAEQGLHLDALYTLAGLWDKGYAAASRPNEEHS